METKGLLNNASTECLQKDCRMERLLVAVTRLAVFSISPRFTHLAGRSVEALITETLPTAKQPILALTIVGAPVIHTPRTCGAIVPKVSWTAGMVLRRNLS